MIYSRLVTLTVVWYFFYFLLKFKKVGKCKCLFTNDSGFEVHEHGSGNMFPLKKDWSLPEVVWSLGLCSSAWMPCSRLQLPASVTDLNSRLTHMNGDRLAGKCNQINYKVKKFFFCFFLPTRLIWSLSIILLIKVKLINLKRRMTVGRLTA